MEFENKKIEESVLGVLMSNPKETRHLLINIKKDYFFSDKNQVIFEAIKRLSSSGNSVDLLSIKAKTKIKSSEIATIIASNSGLNSLKTHIKILKDYSDLRWFKNEINNSTEKLETKKALVVMSKLSSDIIEKIRGNKNENTSVGSLLDDFESYQQINRDHLASGEEYIGIPCGYKMLDEAISGIRGQHYWVVTAYTNVGKSYFLLNIVNNVLNQGKRVLFFSLEMSKNQNIARILGIKTMINPIKIEKGTCLENLLEDEMKAKAELYEQQLELYNQKKNIEDILITIQAEHSTKPVDLIVIDYIQKIQTIEPMSRYERFTMASDSLQKLCQELSIPAIVASQIGNDSAKSNNRDIISTKGSGDIAADADFSLKLQKTQEQNEIECIIQKNRHGAKGFFNLRFGDGGILKEII